MKFFRNLFKKKEKILIKEQDNVQMEFDVTDEDNPKPIKATVSFNLFGEKMSFDYDFSEEAQEGRRKQREIEKRIAWTKESGERLNRVELELIGCHYADKKYSENSLYCAVYVREFIKNESLGKGKVWLIDCIGQRIVFSLDTDIIQSIYVLNNGILVYHEFKRGPLTDNLVAYNVKGENILKINKSVGIQLDSVDESGLISGHYLDDRYSSFHFILSKV